MYVRTARAQRHRLAVDRPLATGGYIGATADPRDTLPNVATMTVEALRAEQAQLRQEVLQAEQDLALSRTAARGAGLIVTGQKKAVLCARLAAVNARLRTLTGPSDVATLMQAARDLFGDDGADRLRERAHALRRQHQANHPKEAAHAAR